MISSYVTERVTSRVCDFLTYNLDVQKHRAKGSPGRQESPTSRRSWLIEIPSQTQFVCDVPSSIKCSSQIIHSYDNPPLYDVTVEEFERCALDRLRILAEIESSAVRNRTWEELKTVTNAQCLKYLPLHATSAKTVDRDSERRKDHLGHYVLRLAFCRSYVSCLF